MWGGNAIILGLVEFKHLIPKWLKNFWKNKQQQQGVHDTYLMLLVFFFFKAEWTVQETNVISVLGTSMRKVITFIHHPPVRFGVLDDQVSCSHSVSVSLWYFLSDLSSQSSSWMSVYITSTLYHMGTNDILSTSAHGTPWWVPLIYEEDGRVEVLGTR